MAPSSTRRRLAVRHTSKVRHETDSLKPPAGQTCKQGRRVLAETKTALALGEVEKVQAFGRWYETVRRPL
ncbi:hypothetical protein ABZS71_34870 [Streptomyces sp. NPDC005393]|uniref:hypothetical protein n=1 Tax=Streptomyces sp. NPDC005393 TaxID=3157041 RepID=UPI0033BE343E